MAVKIRLARRGRKNRALYDIVVADARAPRDGRFIEKLGTYNPNTNPATIILNTDRSAQWLMNGAQPTDTANAILRYKGVLYKKHLQVGVNKGAITQEVADARFAEFMSKKDGQVTSKIEGLAAAKVKKAQDDLAREIEVNAARAAAIVAKNTPPQEEAPAAEEAAPAAEEEAAAPAVEAEGEATAE
jgi:small subunit ribosomal protein S16